jgi:methionyl-tRNA formyltransferase
MNIIFSSHRNAEHREVVEKMLKKYSSSKITNIYSKECISKINPETSYDLLISDRTQFIFPAPILKNVKTAINSHPSMLPLHKGSQPIFWATLLEDPLGISIHQISEKIDEGDVFYQKRINYKEEDTFCYIHGLCREEIFSGIESIVILINQQKNPLPLATDPMLLDKHPPEFHHKKVDCFNLLKKLPHGWNTTIGDARKVLEKDLVNYKFKNKLG